MHPLFTSRLSPAIAIAFCLAWSSPTLAQTNVPTNTGGPRTAQPDKSPIKPATAAVAFAEAPFRLDALGLVMKVPEGATASSVSLYGRPTTQLMPADNTWILNVQTPKSGSATTLAKVTEETLLGIQANEGVIGRDDKMDPRIISTTQAEVLERNDALKINGADATRFYVSAPTPDGKTILVKGYTIFQPSPQQFVVFELVTSKAEFAKSKGIYETVVGTAHFEDASQTAIQRGALVKAGVGFFSGLTEADYVQAMIEKKTWQRLYQPSPTGSSMDAKELGYRGIRFWRGVRGEIDPQKPKSSYGSAEKQEGYLCSVEGRFIIEGGVADSRGVYFMTPDRNEEAWSVQTVYRDASDKQVSASSETGARIGESLNVVKKGSGEPVKQLAPPMMGEGYISKFETFLLPRLLVRKKIETTIGVYAWSERETISYRKDEVARTGSGRSSTWSIKTSFRDEPPSQNYTYTDAGDLIRGEVEGLGTWEPMEPDALFRLWKQKDLPTDK